MIYRILDEVIKYGKQLATEANLVQLAIFHVDFIGVLSYLNIAHKIWLLNLKGIFVSLFEDSKYQYRDTYFVFLQKENRPSLDKIESSLAELGPRYQTLKSSELDGEFEALTFVSPYDYSAMDIAVVQGEEVNTQIQDLLDEFKTMTLTGDDSKKLTSLGECDCRFDIFHFEHVDGGGEDEFLDPGGLLLVMEKLSELSDGVALDPQSHSLF